MIQNKRTKSVTVAVVAAIMMAGASMIAGQAKAESRRYDRGVKE